jgi:multicomponent Na+:H+ antiporter subunit A
VGIALGLFPFFVDELLADASVAMTPGTEAIVIGLSLDIGPSLGSLAVTLLIGAAVYVFWDPLHRLFEGLGRKVGRIGMASQYERSLTWLPEAAAAVTRRLQHGRLPGYLALTVGTVSLGLLAALWPAVASLPGPPPGDWSWGVAGSVILIGLGAVAAAWLRERLTLLLASGLVGYGSAALFLFVGAPDLAFTQFTVETVFVVVVAAVLLKLKRLGRPMSIDEPPWRPAAALVSMTFATLITALLLLTVATPFDATLSEFFAQRSVPEAYGRNVVNVILVDFRALDTLGEIAVVALSFLAALPLLRSLRGASHALQEGRR